MEQDKTLHVTTILTFLGHCLLNYYKKGAKLGWHYDRVVGFTAEESAKEVFPVVSISVGDSGEFKFKMKMEDKEESVILNSGDVIVFGGPARNMYHTAYRVFPHTAPKELDMKGFPGRFNMTFRAR